MKANKLPTLNQAFTQSARQTDMLQCRRAIERFRPDRNPFAQYVILYTEGCVPGPEVQTILLDMCKNYMCNYILFIIQELQFFNGLRISEVLRVRLSDVTKSGQIMIRGSKKSNNRLITPAFSNILLMQCKANRLEPFATIDRYYVYRQYKKSGISKKFAHASNNAVTHLFRYVKVNELHVQNVSNSDIQQFIGHKSIKSTEHYVKKGK